MGGGGGRKADREIVNKMGKKTNAKKGDTVLTIEYRKKIE